MTNPTTPQVDATAAINNGTDRTPIYNSVAKLREAFSTLCNSDPNTMQYFEQHALIIVTGTAHIADQRDIVFEELVQNERRDEYIRLTKISEMMPDETQLQSKPAEVVHHSV